MFRKKQPPLSKEQQDGKQDGLHWRVSHEASGIIPYDGQKLILFAEEQEFGYKISARSVRGYSKAAYLQEFILAYTNTEVTLHNASHSVKDPIWQERQGRYDQ